jgi:hypothetical protein
MGLSNVTKITQGSEDRVLLESFTEGTDKNAQNGKIGIRCHSGITAFFLKMFAWMIGQKVVEITTTEGKVYSLNKNSFDQWRARHADALAIKKENPAELPTAEEIITRHKEVIQEKKTAEIKKQLSEIQAKKEQEEAALKAKQEKEAAELKENRAVKTQALIRRFLVKKEYPKLQALKKEIDLIKQSITSLETKKKTTVDKFDDDLKAYEETKANFQKKIDSLSSENQTLDASSDAKKLERQKLLEEITAQKSKAKKKDNAFVSFIKDLGPKDKKKEEQVKEVPTDFAPKLDILNQEISELTKKITSNESHINIYNEQVKGVGRLIAKWPQKKENTLTEIQTELDAKNATLAESNRKLNEQILKMNGAKSEKPSTLPPKSDMPAAIKIDTVELDPERTITTSNPMEESAVKVDGSAQTIVEPSKVEPAKVNHVETMSSDISNHSHPELNKIMKAIVDKFGETAIKSWEFNAATGEFKATLDKTLKLWVRPLGDNGKADSKTPQGVVLLFGNNPEAVISGRLEKAKNTIHFAKGLNTYCRYKKYIMSGEADGVVEKIEFTPKNQNVSFYAKGTDRKLGMGGSEVDTKKLSTMLKDWNAGLIPPNANHEGFLTAQKSV